jgi:tetratricopeptide (TPR) repeat protein
MQLRRTAPYLVLLFWTAILYFPSLSNPFVYDDQSQIVKNPNLNSSAAALVYFRKPMAFDQAFAGQQSGSFYRPFFWLSLLIDHLIGGRNPEVFHATNLLVHALNGILVFLIFRRWFTGPLPLLAALAWLSLPIHTEVVAWISGRGMSLATFFVLLDIFSALKYAERRNWKYLCGMTLASGAALLSHEAGIVAPILATLAVVWWSPAAERRRSTMNVIVAISIPLIAYTVLRMAVFSQAAGSIQPLTKILLQGPVSLAKYVWWTIYAPAMSMERSTEFSNLKIGSWTYAAAWLTILVCGAGIALRRYVPLFVEGVAGAAIALVPFGQLLKLYQSVAERYAYTASIGIILAIVAILAAASLRLRLPAWSAAAVLAVWIALSFMPLRERVHAWSSEFLLYHTSLSESPKSAVLNLNLGVLNHEAGNAAAAEKFYQAAIQLQPSYQQAHINLANLYAESSMLSEAVTEYKLVLDYDPENVAAQLKLGHLMAMQGDYDAALSLLTRVVQEHPDSYEAEADLGILLYQKRDPAARDHFERALQIRPDSPENLYNLAILEEDSGHFEAARELYQRVLRYHPGDTDAAQHLQRLR